MVLDMPDPLGASANRSKLLQGTVTSQPHSRHGPYFVIDSTCDCLDNPHCSEAMTPDRPCTRQVRLAHMQAMYDGYIVSHMYIEIPTIVQTGIASSA